MSENFNNHIKTLLKQDTRLVDEEGELIMNKIKDFANNLDPELIELLLSDDQAREKFFLKIKEIYVFKNRDFIFYLEQNSLDNSFTQYANKIGLTFNGKFLKDNTDVVLDFPYKDCILEGGQSTEEGTDSYFQYDEKSGEYLEKNAKRKEIFYNNIIAKDEIDRLFEPKAFSSVTKYTVEGPLGPDSFTRDESGRITDNLIIKGNNLLALHSLMVEFKGKIKLIYIDPPYNTGNDEFAYNDRFNHSAWLTFIKNRLTVAHELLHTEGTLAVSIDHNEVAYMISLLDNIFGKNNKKNIISIKRSSVSGAKVINPGVVNVSEFLLLYSKSAQSWKPKKVFRAKDRDVRYNNFIVNINDDPSNWKYESVLSAFAAAKGIQKSKLKKELGADYDIELEKFFIDNKDRVIRFAGLDDKSISESVRKMKYVSKEDPTKTYIVERENHNDYFLVNGNAILFFKDRLIEVEGEWKFGEMISDIWHDVLPNDIHNEGGVTLRKGKKPEKLLNRLVELCTDENDLILDYHLGSGTTAAVAHKMGRQYIGVEQLNYGDNDCIVRLQNVIAGDNTGISKMVNWQGGGSFVYLELAKNNEKAKDLINACTSFQELEILFTDLYEKYFLNYNIKIQEFKNEIIKEDNFKNLPLDKQKEIFCSMLDNNQLYVNIDDMEDSRYGLSPEDIRLTKDFYEIKD